MLNTGAWLESAGKELTVEELGQGRVVFATGLGHDGGVINRWLNWLNELLHRPTQVFWICLAFAAVGIILDGSALRLWSLHRDHDMLSERIEQAKIRSRQLKFRIQEAQQPEFIERAARDQFDLVKEGDLIFVFAEESTSR